MQSRILSFNLLFELRFSLVNMPQIHCSMFTWAFLFGTSQTASLLYHSNGQKKAPEKGY